VHWDSFCLFALTHIGQLHLVFGTDFYSFKSILKRCILQNPSAPGFLRAKKLGLHLPPFSGGFSISLLHCLQGGFYFFTLLANMWFKGPNSVLARSLAIIDHRCFGVNKGGKKENANFRGTIPMFFHLLL